MIGMLEKTWEGIELFFDSPERTVGFLIGSLIVIWYKYLKSLRNKD